ncbi:MAG: SRPBCC family protein [Labilithrix sp.]|nr:SRPBCC family protein [Labilithrix sp.]MBX3213651.1 SRPBCC family protein [Labilithrix sp.]
MTTSDTLAVTVTIERPWTEVYDFASIPLNFQRWASGLGGSLRKVDDEWTAAGPDGPVRVRFSERNAFGVLDHWVTPEDGGAAIYIPLRVIANGDGAEVTLTVFRAGRSDEAFAADADWVRRDLGALKALLEA